MVEKGKNAKTMDKNILKQLKKLKLTDKYGGLKRSKFTTFNIHSNKQGILLCNINITSKILERYPFNTPNHSLILFNGQPRNKSLKGLIKMIEPDFDISVVSLDITNNIPFANVQQIKDKIKILGYTLSDIIGNNIIFIFHKDTTVLFQEPKNYDKGKDNIYFYVNINTDYKKIYIRLILHVYKSETGTYELTHKHIRGIESRVVEDSEEPTVSEESDIPAEPVVEDSEEPTVPEESDIPAEPVVEDSEEPAVPEEPVVEDSEEPAVPKDVIISKDITSMKKKTYTYNPEDIHALLRTIKVMNTQNVNDKMNGEYLIGHSFGYEHKYKNLYSQIVDTDKYKLSGYLDVTTNKIKWLKILTPM